MKVTIEKHYIGEGGFTYQGKHWTDATLYKAVEGLKPFKLPLIGIDMSAQPWGLANFKSFLYHYKRIKNADFKYPIILSPDGVIIDGWHRIAKAVIEGKETINAVALKVMPEVDEFLNTSE